MICSRNEWDPLQEIVVGSAVGAFWPTDLLKVETAWKETPIPQGRVNNDVILTAQRELDELAKVLEGLDITVQRPRTKDFSATDGLYNYCPRDRLLILDNTVVVPNMMMPCRNQEIECLDFVIERADRVITMPTDDTGMVLDAANVCRINDTLLILRSSSGSDSAIKWLTDQLPEYQIEVCDFYGGTHIDSTVSAIRDGVVVLNAQRVNESNCPQVFEGWTKIWVDDVVAQPFHDYPYASKWIGMNMLAVDPQCVIVDVLQTDLIRQLEQHRFTVIPMQLSHSRTLGGGFHCVTLDLRRDHG